MTQSIEDSPYLAYSYSYPHKTAYRQLRPRALSDVWEHEKKDSLFLYLHIPFCEMRCGFCNLFTLANPAEPLDEAYVSALLRELNVVSQSIGTVNVTRMAIGGGTPTYLTVHQLNSLFDAVENTFDLWVRSVPCSVETSPHTATPDKLNLLESRGVERISMGVQSFLDEEVYAVGRAQEAHIVHTALSEIRKRNFRSLNIDLIYGLPEQSEKSFLFSLNEALRYQPDEIYLYPLYVRTLTGLDRRELTWSDRRVELYRIGRDYLLSNGYEQLSMRMFQKPAAATALTSSVANSGQNHGTVKRGPITISPPDQRQRATANTPVYCCQTDGMLGLGCGARSYTSAVHYSSQYAVSRNAIRGLLQQYCAQTNDQFRQVTYGYELHKDDTLRRFVIQSILQVEGLHLLDYAERFSSDPIRDLPELGCLLNEGLLKQEAGRLLLTQQGLEASDTVGVRLYSQRAIALMQDYVLQ